MAIKYFTKKYPACINFQDNLLLKYLRLYCYERCSLLKLLWWCLVCGCVLALDCPGFIAAAYKGICTGEMLFFSWIFYGTNSAYIAKQALFNSHIVCM